jgi:hypothetical protein
MPSCRLLLLLWATTAAAAFSTHPRKTSSTTTTALKVAEQVQVCGFKDCKRRGGGPRLEKLIGEILEEKDIAIAVESCECQVGLETKI